MASAQRSQPDHSGNRQRLRPSQVEVAAVPGPANGRWCFVPTEPDLLSTRPRSKLAPSTGYVGGAMEGKNERS